MIVDPWLSWVLVALFACSAGYCLWRLFCPGSWRGKIGHVFHLLMCLAMIAMIEPAVPTVPYTAQVGVFTVATLWFVVLALVRGPGSKGVARFRCASGRGTVWYHAVMMATMLWMVVIMGGWLGGGSQPSAAAHSSGGMAGMPDMPGMSMPETSVDGAASGSAHHGAPMWIAVLDVLLGVLFLVAALWWLRRYFELRRSRDGSALSAEAALLCEMAMALGMGVMTLVMV